MPTISDTTQYRASCRTCTKLYTWRATENEAEADANKHQTSKPRHVVDIEKKTIEHTRSRYK